jgi:hypothetical protein
MLTVQTLCRVLEDTIVYHFRYNGKVKVNLKNEKHFYYSN